jgi:hypothetical protein
MCAIAVSNIIKIQAGPTLFASLLYSVASSRIHKVNSGIWLSYRPARLHGLAGRYDNPYAGVDFIPQSGIYCMNSATIY